MIVRINFPPVKQTLPRTITLMDNQMNICPHFGECGGCRFQDLPYRLQLERKEERCRALRDETCLQVELRPIVPSPRVYYYRNKMEFTFGEENGRLVCGLHRRDRNRSIFQLEHCLISSPEIGPITAAVAAWARESGLPAYHPYRHRGFWRNLVIRESKSSGDFLVNLVTSSQGDLDREGFLAALDRRPASDRIGTVLHTVNDSLSNAVIPQDWEVLKGAPFLEETIAILTFRILPFSFFQVNPAIMEIFYRELLSVLRLTGREKILDIFSGSGAIGLVLSGEADSILGIELDPEAVANARINARKNGLENLDFREGKAARVLAENRHHWPGQFDLVIVNPPRSGISKKIAKRLRELAPERIVYSSCNPETFFPQVELLAETHRPTILQPFDFFPHTPHLEMLAVFERLDPPNNT